MQWKDGNPLKAFTVKRRRMPRQYDLLSDSMVWRGYTPLPEEFKAEIEWMGMTGPISILRKSGWEFAIRHNYYTGTKKLYMRHKELRMVGRCDFNGDAKEFYVMDFLTHEKNQFIRPPKVMIENDQVIGMEYNDIPAVLHEVSLLQKQNMKKPIPAKAEIVEFIRKVS